MVHSRLAKVPARALGPQTQTVCDPTTDLRSHPTHVTHHNDFVVDMDNKQIARRPSSIALEAPLPISLKTLSLHHSITTAQVSLPFRVL